MTFSRNWCVPIWRNMNKILGLDLGAKTCGVALSDALGMIASPVKTIRFEEDDYETACDRVVEIIDEMRSERLFSACPGT